MTTAAQPPSARTTVKRGANRADYDTATVHQILDDAMLAHVGVSTDQGPIVLPMAYGRRGDEILIHGGVANAMMRNGRSAEVCLTVTIVDGLVVARTPLNNSMNYRSVVVRGEATLITDPVEKMAALRVINDHLGPLWETARQPSEMDVKITMVLRVSLAEASAKVRTGGPNDEPDDVAGPHWAGVVPLHTTWGSPIPADNLAPAIDVPAAVSDLADTDAHGAGR